MKMHEKSALRPTSLNNSLIKELRVPKTRNRRNITAFANRKVQIANLESSFIEWTSAFQIADSTLF